MEWRFSRVRKIFFRGRIFQEIPEIPQNERFLLNFRLRNLKIQSPKKCNSIPPAIPYPTRLPPINIDLFGRRPGVIDVCAVLGREGTSFFSRYPTGKIGDRGDWTEFDVLTPVR